jgi:predicted outer membrane repeat protein
LSKAIEILGGSDGTIFLCSTLGITTDLILDYSYKITLKRYYSSSDSSNSNLNRLVTINSNLTVSISNIIFDASGYTTNSSGGAILINSGSTVTLTNCSIINSKSNGSGGAIYGNGNLTLNNCVISNNYSYDEGGAIRILSGGNLTVTDSVFENNTSGSYCSGGAIDITNSSFSCSNTNFVGNIASMYGGAIYFNSSSSYILTITDCTFSNNTSKSGYSGGAIYCYGILNCSGSTFTQNSTYSSNGGAIFFEGNFDSTIINNTFASNFSYNGGAIFFESQTNTLTITDCIFSDNKANYTTYCYGGAIYSNGNLVISGTSFTSNTSDYSGGAIYSTTTGIVTCTDSSFTSNTSVYSGGAIYSLLSVTCTRTIFRSNSPTGQSGAVYAKSLYLIDCEFNVVYLNPNSTYDATTNPYVGSDSNDGTSHTTPVLTLDKALELLGDEEGTITLCSTLYLTSSLTLDPDYTITFVRYYDDENESQSNMSNMIDISSGIIVQLSNIVFDGKAISLTTNGGSIFNKGKLVLSDCVFKANKTTGIGGAIYSLSGGTIYATNCSFLNNYATSGGAIYSTSNVTCTTTTFSGNRPNGQSGAIYCGRTLTLKNCEFSNVVYLNTNSTYNANTNYYPGSDSNDGTVNSPVLTLDKAYELLGGEGVIYFYNTLTISSSTTIGWTETVTFKRYYDANSLLSNTNSILYINSGVTATLSNIIFDGESTLMSASGGAIYNLGTLTITNCKFNYNYATVYGGAIYSLGEMNISYTSFLNNYAISYGGAIYCSENDLTLSHCTFSSNTGYSGGAIRIQKTTNDLTLSMTNCSFESNYASSSAGGAVYSQNATITGSDNSFLNNTSAKDGSAIYVNYALTTLTNCTFTGNVSNKTYTNLGGAILFYGSKDLTLTGCDFENNSGYKGSAVCLHTGSSPNSNKILITDCDFTDNTANYGGAIFSDFINSVTIDGCNFVSNSATNGGAIYKDYFSGITVKNSTFTENTSIYSGGAVYLTSNNSATFEGCTFTSNSSANYSGSAVYADSTETTFTNCNFYTNTNTSSGGALYLYASSSINGCIFDGNSSNFGGAIYVNDTSSTLTIVDSQFLNNVAGASGGALYLKNILSCSGTSFTGNYSTYCGGAICMYKDYSIEINACTFTKNTARYGGAIYSKGDVVCNTGTSFVSNTASISGGAIYALGDVSCTEVYFKGNFPRGREGAIYVSGVKTLTDCEFINIVYLNPQTGNDSNDGLGIGVNEDGSEAPLLTLQAAVDFLSDDGTIYLCGTLSISGDLTVGSNDYNIVIIRYYNADNESLSCTSRMFEISSDATVHFINTTIDGNADYSSDYTAITIADTATVYFDDNTVIQNCVSSGSGVTSGIVVSAGATLVLNGTQVLNTTYFFIANYGAVELNNVYAENYGWHFVASYSTATSLTMNNCTIKNGGRAISVFSSAIDIIIKNSYFYNCSIVADGGCLYIHSSSSVLIENCTFESCSSQGKAGGAIYITDCSNVTFTNCDFINNKAAGNYGAHIRILPTSNDGVYTFTNCTFTGGSAFTGGGISIFNENYYSNISIQGCTFDSIYGASSACIYVYASTLLISDSCFTNNRGGGESGIYGVITATMAGTTQSFIMTNTVVTGNVKDKNTVTDGDNMGGGVSVLFSSSDATATITGCVIDNNTCLGDNALGGGLYIANSEDGGTVTITDTSISGNYSAYNSGGAYIDLWSTNSLLTIEGCSFNNNVAEHNAGSISVGSRSSISSIEVNNSDFKYNNASNYSGGLFCYNSGSFSYLTFESNFSSVNCVLDFYQLGSTNKETLCDNLYLVSNTSNGSGALFDSTISTHKFIFTNCNFIDNSASGNGGAASLSGSGSASFTDCSFTNNSAYTGGAIWSIIPTTISNCSFIDNVSASYGGAIYLNSSAISTISNSIFDGNITKTGGGGGLFTWSSTSINDCVFKNNKAGSDGSGSGAGIALQGTNSVLNRVEISNNTVSNTGGGLYNYGSITILNNCNIYGNTAYNGGGVYVSSGSVTFNYCNIYGNTSGGAGGGIYTGSTTTLYYCNIYNNVANGTNYSGGAIYSTSYCNLSLSYCNIYGNSGAMRGGGIVLWDYATILNCNFYDNKALYVGGAICIIYGYQTQIQNCEFSNNSASYGSAIFVDNPITNSYEINFVIDGCSFISNKSTQGTIYSNFLLEITNCSFEDNISTTGAIIYSGNDKLNVPIGTTYYTDSSLTTVGGTTTVTSYCRVLNSTYCYGSLNLSGWTTVYFKTSDLIALEEETPGSVNIRTVTLTDCTITGNVSTSGGLVYMSSDNIFPAKLTMTGCTISGNSDGAGASLQVENYATANITDCVFTDNQGGTAVTTPDTSNGASGEVGGGVSVGTNATLNLTDCTFVSTIDENFVFAKADGTLNLTNTTVSAPNVVFTRGPIETAKGSHAVITGGTISGLTSTYGGALYIDGEAYVVDITIMANNYETKYGGGIYVAKNGNLTLNAIIKCNTTALGKGIYVLGTATMVGGEISGGADYGGSGGGGVYVANGGKFSMQKSESVDERGNTIISYGEIKNNYCGTGGGGGGIYIASGGTAVIEYGEIKNNYAYYRGGGIYVAEGGTLVTGKNALISGNYIHGGNTGSAYGMGVYNAGTMIMNGGTISGNYYNNSTSSFGGGIYSGANSTLTIKNATISNNRSYERGGGIFLAAGCVAYIENTIISGNRSADTQGGAIYATSGAKLTVVDSEISGNWTDEIGTIYIEKSEFTLIGSSVSNNSAGWVAGIYFNGQYNNLTIEDCIFEENIGNRQNSSATNLNVYIANKVSIKNSYFTNGYSAYSNASASHDGMLSKNSASVSIKNAMYLELIDCVFNGNVQNTTIGESYSVLNNGGALNIYGTLATQTLISGCTFENNIGTGKGGALSINIENADAVVNIIDSTFTGNQSVGYYDSSTSTWLGGCGGAIYLGGTATVNFSGDITVTDNLAGVSGGGIYVDSLVNFVIKKNAKMVVEDNFANCGTTTQTVTINSTDYSVTTLVQSTDEQNMFVVTRTSALSILEGDLADGSSIGVSYSSSGTALAGANDCIIKQADVEKLFSDNANYTFELDTTTNSVSLVGITSAFQVIANDLVYAKKNRTTTDDGKYGVTKDDLQFLNASGAVSVEFYSTSDGSAVSDISTITAWSETSARFGEFGSYIIYYRAEDDNSIVTGSLVLRIVGEMLYLETAPKATLKYGETLSKADFTSWSVVDEDGNNVTGTWAFTALTTIPTDMNTKYAVTFTPSRANYYEQTLATSIYVSIGYDIVFYKPSTQENAGGEFYTDVACTLSTSITTLGTMISYLNDGGTIVFMGTYQVGAGNNVSETISVSKTIYFVRHSSAITSEIIEILFNATENYLSLSAPNGEIVFEGAGQYTGNANAQAAAILNNGTLTIGNNVIFRNFTSQGSGTTGALGAVITNDVNGTLIFNGGKMYGNTATTSVSGGDNFGGAVYNAGEMIVNSGDFLANVTVGTGGKGGFVYNVGSLLINGGNIFANVSYYGGAIYVADGGSVTLSGGVLKFNTATASGGACYIASGGELSLNGTSIFSNRAGGEGAGVYSDGTLFNSTTGNIVSSSTVEELEEINEAYSDLETTVAETDSNNTLAMALTFAVLAVMLVGLVTLNEHRKRKQNYINLH